MASKCAVAPRPFWAACRHVKVDSSSLRNLLSVACPQSIPSPRPRRPRVRLPHGRRAAAAGRSRPATGTRPRSMRRPTPRSPRLPSPRRRCWRPPLPAPACPSCSPTSTTRPCPPPSSPCTRSSSRSWAPPSRRRRTSWSERRARCSTSARAPRTCSRRAPPQRSAWWHRPAVRRRLCSPMATCATSSPSAPRRVSPPHSVHRCGRHPAERSIPVLTDRKAVAVVASGCLRPTVAASSTCRRTAACALESSRRSAACSS